MDDLTFPPPQLVTPQCRSSAAYPCPFSGALATWVPIGFQRIIRERPARRGRQGECTSIRDRLREEWGL